MSNNSVDNQFSEINLLQMVQTYHNNMAELLRLGNRVIESNRSPSPPPSLSPSPSPSYNPSPLSRSNISILPPLLRSYRVPLIQPRSVSTRTTTDDPTIDTTSQWLQQLLGNYTDISYSFYVQMPETTTTPTYNRITTGQLVDNIRIFAYRDEMSNDLIDVVCPISQCDFREGDILCELNRCKHVFKQEEIFRWLNQHTNCPVCRTELVLPENERNPIPTLSSTAIYTPGSSRTNETERLGNNLDNILNEALLSLFRSGSEQT